MQIAPPFNFMLNPSEINVMVLRILSISSHKTQNLSLHINTPEKDFVVFTWI